jgi:2-haloacid dehalogenase
VGRVVGRRDFVGALASSLVFSASTLRRVHQRRIEAVAFDGFAVFDPTPTLSLADDLFPGRGRELISVWRTRLFEYQWLRTLGGRYGDFRQTAGDALATTVKALALDAAPAQVARLLESQLTLTPWPDAVRTVSTLHSMGFRLAFLSNMTARMLDDGARRAGIRDHFEHILSTDRVMVAKPDPRSYQMAVDAFRLRRNQIAFVAFAGWDAAGATWFGYPTAWVNRAGAPAEELGATPSLVAGSLTEVVEFVAGME